MLVYFSATGTTQDIAIRMQEQLGCAIYAVTPEASYSSDDLNWHNDQSRANIEQNDDAARPVLTGELPDLSQVDTVYLGTPLWWGKVPRIVQSFIEQTDLTGKTVHLFCTSGSSPVDPAAQLLQADYPDINWGAAVRFESAAPDSDIAAWLETTARGGA